MKNAPNELSKTEFFSKIKAFAFDIDGTLYNSSKLYFMMIPYILRNLSFYIQFAKVRKQLHKTAPVADFYEYQARLLAINLKCSPSQAKTKIQKIVYDGMKKFFNKIKPYPYAKECIQALKNAGYKIAILSDFPPEQKGDIWGIKDLCDVCIGSEESGALKPSIYPYGILSQKLNLKNEEILYVGNSKRCDVFGASNAKMKTAFILSGFRKIFNIKYSKADICFKNYRQLQNIVLN